MKTKLANIHQIESTSVCNFACEYCIHPKLKRAKQHMGWDTFERSLLWTKYLAEGRDQQEVALTGCGEPFLNPRLPLMMQKIREWFPDTKITVSTNGTMIDDAMCDKIKDFNPEIFISMHDPEIGERAADLLSSRGLLTATNEAFHGRSFDWAGQVDWPVRVDDIVCSFLMFGNAVVLSNGDIVRCCMDAEGLGVLGNVFEEPHEIVIEPFELCGQCHMIIPTKDIEVEKHLESGKAFRG